MALTMSIYSITAETISGSSGCISHLPIDTRIGLGDWLQESLKLCVMKRLPQLLKRATIKLVVIDSIAGVFRADYEPSQCTSRAKELQKIGVQLHKLSKQYSLAVICVNQVIFCLFLALIIMGQSNILIIEAWRRY